MARALDYHDRPGACFSIEGSRFVVARRQPSIQYVWVIDDFGRHTYIPGSTLVAPAVPRPGNPVARRRRNGNRPVLSPR